MPHLFQKQLISKTCLIFSLIAATTNVLAMSGPFEHPAQAILKDGSPCFFADFGEGTWSGYNLTVVINKGRAEGLVWAISSTESVEKPSTLQSCVQYGQSKGTLRTIKAAAPLHDGLPYLTIIHLSDRARYGVRFCMGKDAQGNPTLTKWNENGDGCAEAPLNETDKPSLWQRLFGT